jgi:REP element-mobilizing transposase RayT
MLGPELPPTSRSRGLPASASQDHATNIERFGLEGDCFHVTAATRKRQAIFIDPESAQVVLDALQFIRRQRAYLLAYALMPDHLHLLVVPRAPFSLSSVMQTIKGYSSRRLNQMRGTGRAIWQQSYYDRIIRDEVQLVTTAEYIEHNPVAAGVVENAGDYTWCSAHPTATVDIEAWLRA